jgi:hypothetical protein
MKIALEVGRRESLMPPWREMVLALETQSAKRRSQKQTRPCLSINALQPG